MNKQDWIIIYLSVVLTVTQCFWVRAEKKMSWFEGQKAIWDAQAEAVNYVCGEYEQPTTAEKRKKHVQP